MNKFTKEELKKSQNFIREVRYLGEKHGIPFLVTCDGLSLYSAGKMQRSYGESMELWESNTNFNDDEDDNLYVINVNGKKITVGHSVMSYNNILKLAEKPLIEGLIYSIMYTRGLCGAKGILTKDSTVPICDGMVFNVEYTGNA
jgi:hypothetical protein